MSPLIAWGLAGLLAFTCLSAAVSLWRPRGALANGSRAAVLATLLEAAAVAVFFRLVVQWTPGTVMLWVAAVAAFAAAVAGAVLRWPQLPPRNEAGKPGRLSVGIRVVLLAAALAVSFAAFLPV